MRRYKEGTAAENGVSQSDIMKRRRAKEEQTLKLSKLAFEY